MVAVVGADPRCASYTISIKGVRALATKKYMRRDTLGAPSSKDPTKTVAERGGEMGLNQSTGTAGRVKTPAPTREATPDQLRASAWGRGNYGANANSFASSIEPGTQVTQKGINIDPPDGDDALALIQQHGAALGGKDPAESWQTRAYDPNNNVPVHSSMEKRDPDSGSPGGTVPKKTGFTEFNPANVRKPGT